MVKNDSNFEVYLMLQIAQIGRKLWFFADCMFDYSGFFLSGSRLLVYCYNVWYLHKEKLRVTQHAQVYGSHQTMLSATSRVTISSFNEYAWNALQFYSWPGMIPGVHFIYFPFKFFFLEFDAENLQNFLRH